MGEALPLLLGGVRERLFLSVVGLRETERLGDRIFSPSFGVGDRMFSPSFGVGDRMVSPSFGVGERLFDFGERNCAGELILFCSLDSNDSFGLGDAEPERFDASELSDVVDLFISLISFSGDAECDLVSDTGLPDLDKPFPGSLISGLIGVSD